MKLKKAFAGGLAAAAIAVGTITAAPAPAEAARSWGGSWGSYELCAHGTYNKAHQLSLAGNKVNFTQFCQKVNFTGYSRWVSTLTYYQR